MKRHDFSAGHIFIDGSNWSLFMNGSGSCGNGVDNLLNHWKLSDKLRVELKCIISPEPIIGAQLELFSFEDPVVDLGIKLW